MAVICKDRVAYCYEYLSLPFLVLTLHTVSLRRVGAFQPTCTNLKQCKVCKNFYSFRGTDQKVIEGCSGQMALNIFAR